MLTLDILYSCFCFVFLILFAFLILFLELIFLLGYHKAPSQRK